jgi:hypothetical protein
MGGGPKLTSFRLTAGQAENRLPGPRTEDRILVTRSSELLAALKSDSAKTLLIDGALKGVPSIRLSPGTQLARAGTHASIDFLPGNDGLQITSDNLVQGLTLRTTPDRRAIFNDLEQESLGTLELRDLQLTGQLQLLGQDRCRDGCILVDGLFIDRAQTCARPQMAFGNGVFVMQGALTIWNRQPGADSRLAATLQRIRIGADSASVQGAGIFLSGCGAGGAGRLEIDSIDVQSLDVDSTLPAETTDRVAAALFVLHNAYARKVRISGEVNTQGANCVALDNWGNVDEWVAESHVRTQGPSAVAIVNAGVLRSLRVLGRVETFGRGARGLSIYADTESIDLGALVTHGDAAAGVHVTRVLKQFLIGGGIETYGGPGEGLVKGVMERMTADAIDIVEGGRIEELLIHGNIIVHGADAAAFRMRPRPPTES